MPRIKSILISVPIDQAKKGHNCQANTRHRIERGDTRLNVRCGRNWDRYCVPCARTIIQRGVIELQELQRNFQTFPDRNASTA